MPFDVHPYLASDPEVVVTEADYLRRLSRLLEATDQRVIANYVIHRYTSAFSMQLGIRYEDAAQVRRKGQAGTGLYEGPRREEREVASLERLHLGRPTPSELRLGGPLRATSL